MERVARIIFDHVFDKRMESEIMTQKLIGLAVPDSKAAMADQIWKRQVWSGLKIDTDKGNRESWEEMIRVGKEFVKKDYIKFTR